MYGVLLGHFINHMTPVSLKSDPSLVSKWQIIIAQLFMLGNL